MADTSKNKKDDKRGLASASAQTRERVAKMGGEAHHDKRGPKGSDNK